MPDGGSLHTALRTSAAPQVWREILRRLGFRSINPSPRQSLQEWWLSLRMQLPRPKRKGFDSLCALVCWQLWKERNARLFRGAETTPSLLLRSIEVEGDNWILAGCEHLGRLFCE
ncbi:hypothetical protein C2845_PM16G24120 [Panicum miliaceum]|uniref:Uncharacterized protein n=1 Tax=Panicum miliaceum TaxID=4540 RepID=A0A3L6PST4_PANMI|nr:hypothetical protein C2845_PM16G24120 [Panicum miliaceum]